MCGLFLQFYVSNVAYDISVFVKVLIFIFPISKYIIMSKKLYNIGIFISVKFSVTITINVLKGTDLVHNGNEMYFVLVKPAVHVVCRIAARMRWPSLRQG